MVGPKGEGVSTSLLGQLAETGAKNLILLDTTNKMVKDTCAITKVERTQRADMRTEIQAVKADMATKLGLAAEREYFVTKLAAERNHLNGEIGMLKEQLAVLKNYGFDRAEWWVKTEDFFRECLKVNDYEYESPEFHYGAFSEFSFRLYLRGRGYSELSPDTSEVGVFLAQTAGSEFIAGSKFKIEVSAKGSEFRAVSGLLDAKEVYDNSLSSEGWGWWSRSHGWWLPKMSELRKAKDVLVSVEFDFQAQVAGVGCTRVLDINRSETKTNAVSKLAAEAERQREHLKAENTVLKHQLANLQYMLVVVLVLVAAMAVMLRNK